MKKCILAIFMALVMYSMAHARGKQVTPWKGNAFDGTAVHVVTTSVTCIISSHAATAGQNFDWIIKNKGSYNVFIDSHNSVQTTGDITSGGDTARLGYMLEPDESISPDGIMRLAPLFGKALTAPCTVYILYLKAE